VLLSGVQGITDLITTPGLINLDFADVKSVMSGAGSALMGIGSSRGDDRAVAAAEMAISSPLLEASIDGAHGVLLSIQGGSDLGLFEINEAAQLVANSAATDANIIFGAVIDDALGDEVRVTVIAAGFDETQNGGGRSARPIAAYQPSQGSDAFGAPWRPVTLPALKDPVGLTGPAAGAGSRAGDGVAAGAPAGVSGSTGMGGAPPSAPADPISESVPSPRTLASGMAAPRPGGTGRAVEAGGAGAGGAGAGADDVGAAEQERDGLAHVGRADGPTTKRRSVVFEEDDELDVPDFLK
jgi:cell division protein FtsZ